MKKQFLNTLLIALVGVVLVACGGNENQNTNTDTTTVETNSTKSKADTRKVVKAYLELKDALVASDVNQARISAKKLSGKAFGDVRSMSESLYATDDLKEQRDLFNKISIAVYDDLKATNSTPITLYKQFCPMAFDNKGAFWLSEEEVIKNPYFGDEMMN
ncbi:MAG: DUF3347 domain-containing protein, partial [Flammeovirgaceae bacterium]